MPDLLKFSKHTPENEEKTIMVVESSSIGGNMTTKTIVIGKLMAP